MCASASCCVRYRKHSRVFRETLRIFVLLPRPSRCRNPCPTAPLHDHTNLSKHHSHITTSATDAFALSIPRKQERTRGPQAVLRCVDSAVCSFAQTATYRGSCFPSLVGGTAGDAVSFSAESQRAATRDRHRARHEEAWRETPLSRGRGCSTYLGEVMCCVCVLLRMYYVLPVTNTRYIRTSAQHLLFLIFAHRNQKQAGKARICVGAARKGLSYIFSPKR